MITSLYSFQKSSNLTAYLITRLLNISVVHFLCKQYCCTCLDYTCSHVQWTCSHCVCIPFRRQFEVDSQFNTLCRILTDQSQPMNNKVKQAWLEYMHELIPLMDSEDFKDNSGEPNITVMQCCYTVLYNVYSVVCIVLHVLYRFDYGIALRCHCYHYRCMRVCAYQLPDYKLVTIARLVCIYCSYNCRHS